MPQVISIRITTATFFIIATMSWFTTRRLEQALSVKHLVDLMSGEIQVDSKPQQGSVFTIVLPLQETPERCAKRRV